MSQNLSTFLKCKNQIFPARFRPKSSEYHPPFIPIHHPTSFILPFKPKNFSPLLFGKFSFPKQPEILKSERSSVGSHQLTLYFKLLKTARLFIWASQLIFILLIFSSFQQAQVNLIIPSNNREMWPHFGGFLAGQPQEIKHPSLRVPQFRPSQLLQAPTNSQHDQFLLDSNYYPVRALEFGPSLTQAGPFLRQAFTPPSGKTNSPLSSVPLDHLQMLSKSFHVNRQSICTISVEETICYWISLAQTQHQSQLPYLISTSCSDQLNQFLHTPTSSHFFLTEKPKPLKNPHRRFFKEISLKSVNYSKIHIATTAQKHQQQEQELQNPTSPQLPSLNLQTLSPRTRFNLAYSLACDLGSLLQLMTTLRSSLSDESFLSQSAHRSRNLVPTAFRGPPAIIQMKCWDSSKFLPPCPLTLVPPKIAAEFLQSKFSLVKLEILTLPINNHFSSIVTLKISHNLPPWAPHCWNPWLSIFSLIFTPRQIWNFDQLRLQHQPFKPYILTIKSRNFLSQSSRNFESPSTSPPQWKYFCVSDMASFALPFYFPREGFPVPTQLRLRLVQPQRTGENLQFQRISLTMPSPWTLWCLPLSVGNPTNMVLQPKSISPVRAFLDPPNLGLVPHFSQINSEILSNSEAMILAVHSLISQLKASAPGSGAVEEK